MSRNAGKAPPGAGGPAVIGPERLSALERLFSMGAASARQMANLVPTGFNYAVRFHRRRLNELVEQGLCQTQRLSIRRITEGLSHRRNWELFYSLTDEGVAAYAAAADLARHIAVSRYKQNLAGGDVWHAALRTEYLGLVSRAAAQRDDCYVADLMGESGVPTLDLAAEGYTYLNPDGYIRINFTDRRPALRCYVEADTGSQTHAWQIERKADRYSQLLAQQSMEGSKLKAPAREVAASLPMIIFVTTSESRRRWLLQVFTNHYRAADNDFAKNITALIEAGLNPVRLFNVTDLKTATSEGALGPSLLSLDADAGPYLIE